jgi:LysM repeat protein
VAQEQEELWDVAKKYHTTVQSIEETNSLKSAVLKNGTKIIIVKQLG